jgi:hypothetical protein
MGRPLPGSKVATDAEAKARSAHAEAMKTPIERAWEAYGVAMASANEEYEKSVVVADQAYRITILAAKQKLAEAGQLATMVALKSYYEAESKKLRKSAGGAVVGSSGTAAAKRRREDEMEDECREAERRH